MISCGLAARAAVALGLVASYYLHLPTGPAVVVILGAMLVVAWIFDVVRTAPTTGVSQGGGP